MNKKLALVQSNYIPWKGYFDLINLVDEFVLFDDAQYTRRDWRNRNRIKTSNGLRWLTIPVEVKGKYFQKINETVISDQDWNRLHWKTITHSYSKAPFFHQYRERFETLYLDSTERYLSQINHRFIVAICEMLDITTKISASMHYNLAAGKTERIVNLCEQAGATEYVSGPMAKAYMQEDLFRAKDIEVSYVDYSGYPEYHQLYAPFEHRVSIIDLILNEGPSASKFMKSF